MWGHERMRFVARSRGAITDVTVALGSDYACYAALDHSESRCVGADVISNFEAFTHGFVARATYL